MGACLSGGSSSATEQQQKQPAAAVKSNHASEAPPAPLLQGGGVALHTASTAAADFWAGNGHAGTQHEQRSAAAAHDTDAAPSTPRSAAVPKSNSMPMQSRPPLSPTVTPSPGKVNIMSPGSGHLAAPHLRPVSSTNSHSTAAATLSFDGRVSSRKSRQWEHGEVGPGGVLLEEAAPKGKDRRPAAGSEAIRDQIRKLAVGATPAQADEKSAIYEVSDSEDEDLDTDAIPGCGVPLPPAVVEAVCAALKNSFVFKGISEPMLLQVVNRMVGICVRAGTVVLQQGALPQPDDCMYVLQEGEANLVVSGAVDQAGAAADELCEVVGNNKIIRQRPGWVFGDVALLFNSSRTASVVAATDITLWALQRRTFLAFVMKHAQGARALRFLRNLPLLKGLSDNSLIAAAARMPQRTYQDGEALIKMGERGDELYLIRYGKVRVLRPDGKGGQIEAVVLGRGQFIGERAVINNKLRSADCVAQGTVQVVVMKKRAFMDLDNPLLAWMMDYDAVSTCMRFVPYVKGIKQDMMEQILDRFDARQELPEGRTIIKQGELMDKLYVIKLGEVQLQQDGHPVTDAAFVAEASGFSFFGAAALETPYPSPYTVVVASESLHLLTVPKQQLDQFLGRGPTAGLEGEEAVIAALKQSKAFKSMSDEDLRKLSGKAKEVRFNEGDVVAAAAAGPCGSTYLVKSGEAVILGADVSLTGPSIDLHSIPERGRLAPGALFNDEAANAGEPKALRGSLVASAPGTVLLVISIDQIAAVRGTQIHRSATFFMGGKFKSVKFKELELHRIIGTGQFGLVRLVRHVVDNEVYALKVMHKAPIVEVKQMEHVVNERRILEEASYPFCVQLRGAYQDKLALYLLQEWVPGGELFHHLDIEGAFEEPTARFFAANVLLALDFLHNKGIVYRDLKPENLLLDAQGYLKMADFGFAKYVSDGKTHTICGTPDYQAPEVIMRRGTTKAADYWALGVLIFEMLVGDPPFKSITGDPWDTFRRTLSGRFFVPHFISPTAADIIFKLLQVNPDRRLGCGPGGANDIKQHPFFAAIDWGKLERKELPAPIVPKVKDPLDTSNFDNFDNCEVPPPPIPANRADKQPNWELWEWIE